MRAVLELDLLLRVLDNRTAAIFAGLVVFQNKHFLADYVLQNRYMLGKFRADWGFFCPLLAHAAVHAAFTFGICMVLQPQLWWLALVDGASHFVIDRIKAGPGWLGRFNDKNAAPFWIILGADQMLHHLVHYFIIYVLVTTSTSEVLDGILQLNLP